MYKSNTSTPNLSKVSWRMLFWFFLAWLILLRKVNHKNDSSKKINLHISTLNQIYCEKFNFVSMNFNKLPTFVVQFRQKSTSWYTSRKFAVHCHAERKRNWLHWKNVENLILSCFDHPKKAGSQRLLRWILEVRRWRPEERASKLRTDNTFYFSLVPLLDQGLQLAGSSNQVSGEKIYTLIPWCVKMSWFFRGSEFVLYCCRFFGPWGTFWSILPG